MKYFRHHATNCFFIESKDDHNLLAIDPGWPCGLLEYQRGMKSIGLSFRKIKWAIVSHFHLDHAGLTSELQNSGIQCIVFENQYAYIDLMEKMIVKKYNTYSLIDKEKLERISITESKAYFNNAGLDVEIIALSGHSADSIGIIQNDAIITGDLPPPDQIMENDIQKRGCWEIIKTRGITKIYPGHADLFNLCL